MENSFEKRGAPREECLVPVNFVCDGRVYTELIRNICKGGMYIGSNMRIPAGKRITLTYKFPARGPVKCVGRVVWDNSQGIGVQLQ